MLIPRTRIVAGLLAALLVAVGAAHAAPQSVLTADGTLYLVEEVSRGQSTVPTALRWREVDAHGVRGGGVIPFTAGPEPDAYPSLTLDPDLGAPALVWSRFNGTDYDLVLSLHDGRQWSAPIPLVTTAGDEIHPVALPAPGDGLHVLWRNPGDGEEFWYGLFRTTTGVAIRGPERVRPGQIPGFGALEGASDEPGIQNSDCSTPGGCGGGNDSGSSGSSGGPSKDCANTGGSSSTGMCKESTSLSTDPVNGTVTCRTVSVVVPVGDSLCLVSRDDRGWGAGPCAPRGAVDFRRAVEARGQSACY